MSDASRRTPPSVREVFEDIKEGNSKLLLNYIESSLDINVIEEYSEWTMLTIAAEYDNLSVAKLLLDNGADPNILETNSTPLAIAVDMQSWVMQHDPEDENFEMIELLLNFGADPRVRGTISRSALEIAISYDNLHLKELLRRYLPSK